MRSQNRAGFTLIELMVAMALTLFIMVILSQAFVLSLETFANGKGLMDMQINLRTATNLLRYDLSQDHFEGKRRLSDVDMAGNALIVQQPVQAGFFAVLQRSAVTAAFTPPPAAPPAYFSEGVDTNQLPSYRAVDQLLYMTVKLRGNRPENFFTASGLPAAFFTPNTAYDVTPANLAYDTLQPTAGFYNSQWAEIAYYLVRVGSTEEPYNATSTLGTPTYELYRAQNVMVPDGTNVSGKFAPSAAFNVLSWGTDAVTGKADFYSPADASKYVAGQAPLVKRTIPQLPQFTPTVPPNPVTTTLVLPNVISFNVQVMPVYPLWNSAVTYAVGSKVTDGAANYVAVVKNLNDEPRAKPTMWQVEGFIDVPATGTSGHLFDTAMFSAPAATYGNNFGLKAIQITLRVFDNKTRQTRQITVVQDL
jgi:prepilin-type N-terminal cleavage/methylation domain-containing protein